MRKGYDPNTILLFPYSLDAEHVFDAVKHNLNVNLSRDPLKNNQEIAKIDKFKINVIRSIDNQSNSLKPILQIATMALNDIPFT